MGFIAINDIQISGATEVSVQITGITAGTTTLTDNDKRLVTEKAIKAYVDNNAGSGSLSGLTDTNISTQIQGQLLTYDSDEGKWINDNTITGNLNIIGDLYVSGTTVTINVQDMNVADNIILVNSGETGSGVTLINAGMEVDRGLLTNYQFVFNETDEVFKVGEIGSLQAVATREDSPSFGGIAYWDQNSDKFITNANFGIDSSGNFLYDLGGIFYVSGIQTGTTANAIYYNLSNGEFIYGNATEGSVTSVSSSTTGQLTVANPTSTPALSIVTGAVTNSGTALATGDQIYDFVIGLGYSTTTGTVTSVSAGDGLDFTTITASGPITLGTPGAITNVSTDGVTTSSHTHSITASTLVSGTDGIIVQSNQFKLDDSYITNQTLPSLYSYTGITSNQDIGSLPSGHTLGMVYITNNGSVEASINLGTTAEGNEISPYTPAIIASGETLSVTVNLRLSSTSDTTMYVNSDSWTNVNIDVEWAHISYQNASIGGGTGSVTEVTSTTTNQLTIANSTTAPALTIVTGAIADSGTALATGDQIHTFVTGLGYGTVTGGGTGLSTVANDAILTGNGTSALTAESNLTFDGSTLAITGSLTVSNMALSATTYGVYYNPDTSGFTYGVGGGSGSGGFLGTVTKDTAEPSNLSNNQWVAPAPQGDGTYDYTFDNFLNQSAVAITVNLAEENVYLRYNDTGNYWIKESYNKPLASGTTWIGNSNHEAKEISVVEEWSTVSGVTDIGQKYDQQVQTLMKVSAVKTTYIQNFVFVENIDLTTVANTLLINSSSNKNLLIKNIKLIILDTANPTSFTVNVGTNSSTYNNVVNAQNIQDVIVDEYYNLTLSNVPAGSDGTIVSISGAPLYFRVSSASGAGTLNCHILLEGFMY